MKKKCLALAVLAALTSSITLAADVHVDREKMTRFQEKASRITSDLVKAHVSTEQAMSDSMTLNLAESIDLALKRNRDVEQALWAYKSAEAQVSATAAGKNPSFTYGYRASRSGQDNGVVSSASNSFGHSLGVSVPLFTAQLDAAIEGSRYSREGAHAKVTAVSQDTKLSATKNYYTLIMARNKVEIAKQSVKDYEGHLHNVNLQYQVGIVAKSDVLATNTQLANAQTALVQAQNGADLAEAQFNNTMALPASTKIVTADKELNYVAYPMNLQEAQEYAKYHRAEIQQMAMALKTSEESLKQAESGHIPTVAATASHGWSDDTWKGTDTKNWSLGASVSWSLWDGGATNEKVKVAKANVESAKAGLAKTIEGVDLQVRQAYLNMRSAEQTISSTRTAVEQGQENFRIASLRYRAGVGTNLDVLDAETALSAARNNYVDALYNYNISIATLEQAVGVPLSTPVAAGVPVVHEAVTK